MPSQAQLNDYFNREVIHGSVQPGSPQYQQLYDSWWQSEAQRQGISNIEDIDIGRIQGSQLAQFQQETGALTGGQASVTDLTNNGLVPQGTTLPPAITATPNTTPSVGTGMDLGSLVSSVPQTTPVAPSLPTATPGPGPQGYSQNEAGAQTGGYTSVGSTNQTQTGQQTQSTTGQQDTTQSQTSAGQQNTDQTQTGQTTTTGQQVDTGTQVTTGQSTTTSGVDTPFDLGGLINTQIGAADATDANKTAFLTDFMNTGGTGFNSQVDQAIRGSLSGPQMSGAGDSARARAAGYGAAQVARNNAGERLTAASLLGGPSGTSQNVAALAPLLNKTESTSTSGTAATNNTSQTQQLQDTATRLLGQVNNTGTQNTIGSNTSAGTSNTLDLQSLVGNEAQAGTATGQSTSQGSGVAPAGQQVKSGGCVVCTTYVSLGEMKPGAVRRACQYKQRNWHRYGVSLTGYLLYGPWIARAVLSSRITRNLVRPVARAILYEEVRLSAPTRLRLRWNAYITHGVFDLLSWPVGAVMLLCGVTADVRDKKIKQLLRKYNLEFTLN